MTIYNVFLKKKISINHLSKLMGVSFSSIKNVIYGKKRLKDCSDDFLSSLASVYNISKQNLLNLKPVPYNSYYEENMPMDLKRGIKRLSDGRYWNNHLLDCYYDEVMSDINVFEVEHVISHEHATYLRDKYIWCED